MKTKKLKRSLILNKKTVANLTSEEMNFASGGFMYTRLTCQTVEMCTDPRFCVLTNDCTIHPVECPSGGTLYTVDWC